MKHNLFVFLLLTIPFAVSAQKKDKTAVKAAATITVADMKKHLYTIASKEMEGRDTPSPGLEKAANYIEQHFKSIGLQPGNNGSYRQYYNLYKDGVVISVLGINGKTYQANTDYQPIYTLNVSPSTFSAIVFAGYGIVDATRDDYANTDVRGKIVLVVDGAPKDYKAPAGARGQLTPASSTGKINTALNKGAAGVMIVFNNFPRKANTFTAGWRNTENRSNQPPAMAIAVSPAIAESIMGEEGKNLFVKIKEGGLPNKTYTNSVVYSLSKAMETTKVSNVLGLLEGTDLKNEYVVITAHYDHVGKRNDSVIYYGADDDGSGTTGILELSEAFMKAKKAGKGPRRSILFMTVSGEEKGLWGSEYYGNNPVYPLDKTTVDLNIDMIGRTGNEYLKNKDSANYVYIIGDDKLSSDLAPITDMVNNTYTKLVLDRKYNDPNDPNRFYYRSDHYNFAEKGVPIIFYFNGVHADYHKPTDTPDKINYPMMAKRAQLVFYTAWEMANRNEMLKRDIKLEKPKGF
jgi:Zn-dependent M28 family amino/carboxypeptidase